MFLAIFSVIVLPVFARIAQLVEHSTDTRKVLGSTPSARTMNKKNYLLLISFVAVLILASVSIFYTRNSNSEIFNFEKVVVGQQYGDLVVESIQPFSEKYKDQGFPKGVELSRDNYSIEFQGETIVVGEYSVNDPEQAEPNGVYFKTDGKNIPIESFLILNNDLTKNEFGPIGSKGTATIMITDYIKNSYPSEITSTARLVKVISKN